MLIGGGLFSGLLGFSSNLFGGRGIYISCTFVEAIGRHHLNAWNRAMDLKYLTLILTDVSPFQFHTSFSCAVLFNLPSIP